MKKIYWNFFEIGHGKGAPDGVSAKLKRPAHRTIKHGEEIPNTNPFFSGVILRK